MRIVFVSNYFNHHQKPLSDSLDRLTGHQYTFISTATMRDERRQLGYTVPEADYNFLAYESEVSRFCAVRMINEADVVLSGSADYSYISERILSGKLMFKYGERPLRNGIEPLKYLPRRIKWHHQYPKHAPVYLLASSAFAAWDYARMGLFKDKVYRWAYFTPTIYEHDINALFSQKKKNRILWVARLIELKHPEHVLEVARRLKKDGYPFELRMIGIGPLENMLKELIARYNLENEVLLLGAMSPQQVREEMKLAKIFLFTSNKQEGWGAVVNEAMNSGCATIGSHVTGAVPFLIQNEKNGMVYPSGNVDVLYQKTKYLLDNPNQREKMGREAYRSITELWNAETAGKRLIDLSEQLLSGAKGPCLYTSGPCSKAEILKDNWFYK